MGCDIHLHVERRDHNGEWVAMVPPERWSQRELATVDRETDAWERDWFYDRNYALFAWLAGVRNYHDQEPLAEPRGLPEDVSRATAENKHDSPEWGHSHSWFTVAELMAGLDGLVTRHGGEVEEDVYLAWKASGDAFPRTWCGASWMPRIGEADYLAGKRPELEDVPVQGLKRSFTISCKWTVAGNVAFQRFARLLSELTKFGRPEDVRIVFWFDN